MSIFSSHDIIIVDATAEHIRELKETIRSDDRDEVEAYGVSCAKGLWLSFKHGLMNKTYLVDGKVAAIAGCAGTIIGETGQPWLLTSHEVEKISPIKFARLYKMEVMKMLEKFPILENFCAAEYHKAIRLLRITGFKIGEPEKVGKGMFRKFTMQREI